MLRESQSRCVRQRSGLRGHACARRHSGVRVESSMRRFRTAFVTVICCAVAASVTGCAATLTHPEAARQRELRNDAMARAQVWTPTNVSRMNLFVGPTDKRGFAPEALVDCTYVDRTMAGATPKFSCELPDGDEIKVKYGRDNGEVYAEVAATRLLWALGFGADYMYPVQVRCRRCPAAMSGPPASEETVRLIEIAAVERKMKGHEIEDPDGPGWSWTELDEIDERRGGASLAQRDALKLLAAMLQHTDSKRQQQRLICTDRDVHHSRPCEHPFALISDLGLTFGTANALNRHGPGSVNLRAWSDVPVWADDTICRANINKSVTGTLSAPEISEPGRAFLASLLTRLTNQQLRDLFTVSRFPTRVGVADDRSAAEEIGEWVAAFKEKVAAIETRRCGSARANDASRRRSVPAQRPLQ